MAAKVCFVLCATAAFKRGVMYRTSDSQFDRDFKDDVNIGMFVIAGFDVTHPCIRSHHSGNISRMSHTDETKDFAPPHKRMAIFNAQGVTCPVEF